MDLTDKTLVQVLIDEGAGLIHRGFQKYST